MVAVMLKVGWGWQWQAEAVEGAQSCCSCPELAGVGSSLFPTRAHGPGLPLACRLMVFCLSQQKSQKPEVSTSLRGVLRHSWAEGSCHRRGLNFANVQICTDVDWGMKLFFWYS